MTGEAQIPQTLGDRLCAELAPKHRTNAIRALEFIDLRHHFQASQQTMAKHLDVTPATVGKWERQETRIPKVVILYLKLLRSHSVNAGKLAEEIIKIRSAAGFAINDTEGEQKVLDTKVWEQEDFLQDLMADDDDGMEDMSNGEE